MKVFISWSGDISLRFAQNFAGWLESVIQAVKPFVSANDIRTGSRWFSEIGKELEATNFGILCVTPDNKDAPWLLFEAGALSKKVEQSHVCPFLLGVKNSDLTAPLSMFHTADATKPEQIRKLLADINTTLGKDALGDAVLSRVFEKNWGDLDTTIKSTLGEIREAEKEHGAPVQRSSEDMLEELLGIARGLAQNQNYVRISPSFQVPSEELLTKLAYTDTEQASQWYNPGIATYMDLIRGEMRKEALANALRKHAPKASEAPLDEKAETGGSEEKKGPSQPEEGKK